MNWKSQSSYAEKVFIKKGKNKYKLALRFCTALLLKKDCSVVTTT